MFPRLTRRSLMGVCLRPSRYEELCYGCKLRENLIMMFAVQP